MRAAFAETLIELAGRDERIVLLTGDLGFTVWEPFAERFSDRFYNAGVAEQNMVGMASGLAEGGLIPFVYSIATFATMRPYEFIRNGPVHHGLPVRIVGVGGGFDYGHNGLSHYALEDVGLMRLQPGIAVVAPADPAQTRAALETTWEIGSPVYYRLGKQSAAIQELEGRFALGRAQMIGEGTDVALCTLGPIATEALEARRLLEEQGIGATVVVISCVAPAPTKDLLGVLSKVQLAVAAEAHYVTGGVGSLVAEVIAEHGVPCRLVRAGVRTTPRGDTGDREYLHARHGISAAALADSAVRALDLAS
jgi:transketolase